MMSMLILCLSSQTAVTAFQQSVLLCTLGIHTLIILFPHTLFNRIPALKHLVFKGKQTNKQTDRLMDRQMAMQCICALRSNISYQGKIHLLYNIKHT